MKPNPKERLQSLKMVAGGWRPQAIDLDALKTMPAGSIGRCYADQLRR
jgi:ubiquinone biosynthesis protein COQ4